MKPESLSQKTKIASPLGLAAFERLRAEEEPWLAEAFEPPPDFELMAGNRSIIVFGEAGCGKTALRQALARRAAPPGGQPQRLLVDWCPGPLAPKAPEDSQATQAYLDEVLDATALALLKHVALYPAECSRAQNWVQDTLIWFVRRYLRSDLDLRIAELVAEGSDNTRSLLSQWATRPAPEALHKDAEPKLVIAELVKVLQAIGLEGVWVITDGLETWAEVASERLGAGLKAFLSALSLFEHAQFSYKLLLPAPLDPYLRLAGVLVRRRADVHRLQWSVESLVRLVERRLRLATGGRVAHLSDLCKASGLTLWLQRAGGSTPVGWLDTMRPLVACYLAKAQQGDVNSISEAEWKDIRQRHSPRLSVDEATGRVTVGWREVEIPPGTYGLLCYLYKHPGKICSKSELYYLAYRQLESMPRATSDEAWEPRKYYEGLIDTIIWRLRQAVEPDPDDPLIVVTVKGRGIRLDNVW